MIIVEKGTQATLENVQKWINKHLESKDKYKRNHAYFEGEHDILKVKKDDSQPNNKPVLNLAKYITTMATNYLVGQKVEYSYSKEGSAQETFNKIMDLYKRQSIQTHDKNMAKTASISGISYELDYLSSDEIPVPKAAKISESEAEIICDNTAEHNCLYGLHFFNIDDKRCIIEVYDNTYKTIYETADKFVKPKQVGESVIHGFDRVPITELINNEEMQGDFEQQINAIDSYERIFAEQINDIEQFNDSILKTWNTGFYQDDPKACADRVKLLKKERILEFTGEKQDASWLTKIMDQSKISVLAAALRSDIHATSFVPNLTDVNFANNSSGVAMQYKLLGFEALTKEKQSYFEKLLRRRLKLFVGALELLGYQKLDVQDVTITFNRSLPRNDLEMAQIASQIDGRNIIDKQTLSKQFTFYNDEVADNLKKEKEENPQTDYASINNPNIFGLGGLNG